jgi:phosphoribosylglycinamide formyltransferase 1
VSASKTSRLVVLISGSGSNLQAILDACARRELPAEVALVVSNQRQAYGLERARLAGAPTCVLPAAKDQDRQVYDVHLAQVVAASRPDLVVLAGWMRLLTCAFLDRFPNQVINLHPALPGCFPGVDAIARAFTAYQQGGIAHTGVMVHRVPDEGVDSGPVLAQEIIPILPSDTLADLEQRVHTVEHRLLVGALKTLLSFEE